MRRLITAYKASRELITDQIQAVIYNDLIWLNSLVEQQLEKYESLHQMEKDFKGSIRNLFDRHLSGEGRASLTVLLQKLEEPLDELEDLRDELHEQVDKTQELRTQLMDLLQFASDHNADTLQQIYQMGNDQSARYDADGKKKSSRLDSISINHKA